MKDQPIKEPLFKKDDVVFYEMEKATVDEVYPGTEANSYVPHYTISIPGGSLGGASEAELVPVDIMTSHITDVFRKMRSVMKTATAGFIGAAGNSEAMLYRYWLASCEHPDATYAEDAYWFVRTVSDHIDMIRNFRTAGLDLHVTGAAIPDVKKYSSATCDKG